MACHPFVNYFWNDDFFPTAVPGMKKKTHDTYWCIWSIIFKLGTGSTWILMSFSILEYFDGHRENEWAYLKIIFFLSSSLSRSVKVGKLFAIFDKYLQNEFSIHIDDITLRIGNSLRFSHAFEWYSFSYRCVDSKRIQIFDFKLVFLFLSLFSQNFLFACSLNMFCFSVELNRYTHEEQSVAEIIQKILFLLASLNMSVCFSFFFSVSLFVDIKLAAPAVCLPVCSIHIYVYSFWAKTHKIETIFPETRNIHIQYAIWCSRNSFQAIQKS